MTSSFDSFVHFLLVFSRSSSNSTWKDLTLLVYKFQKEICILIVYELNTALFESAVLVFFDLDVDRKSLKINDEPIRETGTYEATANLHKEVKVSFKFEVIGE